MIDQGDLPRPPEAKLTPEQTERVDQDLITISSLTQIAENNDGVFELQGGYATDAHLGGHVRRPHGDIDGSLWYATNTKTAALGAIIHLLHDERTNWKEQNSLPYYEHMIEDDDSKDLPDRRRLEIYMFPKRGNRSFITKTLFDSLGVTHDVSVLPVSEFVAAKIKTLVDRHKQGEEGRRALDLRDTRDSDRSDLLALMSSPDFDREKCIQELSRGSFASDPPSPEGKVIAEELWKIAMELLK